MTSISVNSSPERLKGHVGAGVARAIARFYPNYISETAVFADCVSRCLNEDSVVLDAGCGSGAFFTYSWKDRVRFLAGCDASSGVSRNVSLGAGAVANLTNLPFAGSSFDVIFSRYVLEHLDAPTIVFAEFARVLKPGGKLIVLTPSKYHYVSMLGRLSPHWIHELVGKVRGNRAHDIFPTRFRANSKADIASLAKRAGLVVSDYITMEARPNYLMWSLPSFLLGLLYERAVNRFDLVDGLRSSVIAVLERPGG
ncbi:MAG: class I SAM-dependent methyltransferase [Acidobacteriota bacterium]